ncbi:AAA family ATPase [Dysgonomonas sp. GY617]|uniref:AAA family ATPase n=1 Tax=Dysgonomonas sp. GY617 TaxID=2780420 RepID=UPI001883EF44|nr:AAA family ATPase [Dysgonomonas sp. GY617]MBF0574781.1 AAA family ATPase [Dysgonomonas sp. GY617]
MIKKIDIQKFGLFSDYNWDSEIGNDTTKDIFKKVNIIYGRNYSGKTTLSRIFRCVEKQELHKDYLDAQFIMSTQENTVIDQNNLNYPKTIRVYNTDFVKENLSWIYHENGDIKSFALLGADNNNIVKEIQNIEKDIEDIDLKLGVKNEDTSSYEEGTLNFEQNKKKAEVDIANKNLDGLKSNLAIRIGNKANQEIKKNSNFINQKFSSSYNINSLYSDIDDIRNNNLACLLSEDEENQLKAIIKEEAKETISQVSPLNFNFSDYINNTKALLSKEITLSTVLKELIENDLLQNWVKTGRNLHKETDICAFCENPITEARRKELDGHFSKESEELEQNIQAMLDRLGSLRIIIENYLSKNKITKGRFYVALHSKYEEVDWKWNKAIEIQNQQINWLEEKLINRSKNLFTPIKDLDFSELEIISTEFNSIIDDFNSLIKENNSKSISIEVDKDSARKTLRYHTIKNFLTDIEHDALLQAIAKNKEEALSIYDDYTQLTTTISNWTKEKSKLVSDIKELEKELKNESQAAEKINEHLQNFFGHDSIQLKPKEFQEEGKPQIRFVVKRGNEDARNLSEGECSLIAFCYFVATIEDELQKEDAKNNLIIYIDDPISSLDNNHIFFIFGIINTIIISANKIENVKFNQLFISTHNLEFLKYLHRLFPISGLYLSDNNPSMIHLLIEKKKMQDASKSVLRIMPRHLRLNTTEYIYLFKQIYDIAKPYDNIDNKIKDYEENYTLLYNIGNNMRRFMESYLSFKYAGENNPLYLLNDFFSEIVGSQLNRSSNEYSHLSWLEKGNTLLDIPEAERLAILILKGLKNNDEIHYNALCKKLEVDPSII